MTKPRKGKTIQSAKVARRRGQMRQDLLDTGTRLFAQKGFKAVSVEELIDEVGISRRTFYGFFANKHELAANLINPIFESALVGMKAIEKDKTQPIVPAIIELYIGLWAKHEAALLLLNATDENIFPYIEAGHTEYGKRLKNALKRAEKNGELRNKSADYSYKIINRVALAMLRVYQDHPDMATLYRDAMSALLRA